jgi:hypothetical protein
MTQLLLTLALIQGGDVLSTWQNLRNGAVERNPLLPQSPGWNLAIQSAEGVGSIYVLRRLEAHHRRWALVLTVAGIALEGYAVQHNLQTARRLPLTPSAQ